MNKVIGLYGSSNKGKTNTLNYLIELLKGNELSKGDVPDQREVVPFKGLKIGVTTWGDNEDELKENCKFFEDENCDICISATRTRGKTCDILKDFAKGCSLAVTWERKHYETDEVKQYQTNVDQARNLFEMI